MPATEQSPLTPDLSHLDDDATHESEPDRKVLYLTTPGCHVRNRAGRLVVATSDGQQLLDVPEGAVGAVICVGSVNLSSGVIDHALRNDIHVVYLSHAGAFLGALAPSSSDDATRLRRQVRATEDVVFSQAMACAIVAGKLHNMATLLVRMNREIGDNEVAAAADRIRVLEDRLSGGMDRAQVMGLEGAGTAEYFGCWPTLLPEWTQFTTRRRRPPPDPVNAALGFGGSLLASVMTGAVVAARLEPSLGFLHSDLPRRPSLALDLIEEFRPLIVDQVILQSLRKGSLSPAHFVAGDEPGSIWLAPAGRRIFIDAFEQRLSQLFRYEPLGRTVSYRRALTLQAEQVSLCIRRDRPDYQPVRWRS